MATTIDKDIACEFAITSEHLRRKTSLPKTYARSRDANPFLGQERAQETVKLAGEMKAKGFNLFVATPPGTQAREALRNHLQTCATPLATPSDWIYVNNFESPSTPVAIKLPAGKARLFQTTVQDMITELQAAIPAAFEKPDIQGKRQALESDFKEQQEDAFEALGEEARTRNVAILRTPMGFTLAPMKDGKSLTPDELQSMTEIEQNAYQSDAQEMQAKLEKLMDKVPEMERELRIKLKTLAKNTLESTISQSIEPAHKLLADIPAACDHLEAIKKDLIDNAAALSPEAAHYSFFEQSDNGSQNSIERYGVNVFVDQTLNIGGAPVIEEFNPTLAHLVGRVEHRAVEGVLTTSFMLIKPGALHTANGGYLILDARRLLSEPMSWSTLKLALQSGCIKTESLAEAMNLTSTIILEPAPIPLDIKIILVGDAWIYHLLAAQDPEFGEHFKLLADFEPDAPRTKDIERDYATLLNKLARSKGLLSAEPAALERLIEEAARDIGDSERISLATDHLMDILTEASHRGVIAAHTEITEDDILETLEARDRRLGRIRDRMQDNLMRGISLVQTDGKAIGQINGLSVFRFGEHRFGKPSRISARVRPGTGRVVDIEREARLGGPIHSKGVLILTGYLAGRYIPDQPMSLLASVVLEQSYGGVEGDSASLAELISILSALSETPIKQTLAITGSINQHGEVQAIGGANEKIEGFYDLCIERKLVPGQGVIVPASNVQHLMLRQDIVDACEAGHFAVYAINHVDEALTLLTDKNAQDIHSAVDIKLRKFANVFKSSNLPNESSVPETVGLSTPNDAPGKPPSDPPREPPKSREKLGRAL